MQYTITSALAHDEVDVSTFESDVLNKDTVERLQSRVSLYTNSDLVYDSHEATVQIETAENTYTERRENPPGTHDNPLSEAERCEKFLECAQRAMSEEEAQTVYDRVTNLRTADDLDTVVSVLQLA